MSFQGSGIKTPGLSLIKNETLGNQKNGIQSLSFKKKSAEKLTYTATETQTHTLHSTSVSEETATLYYSECTSRLIRYNSHPE